MIIELALATRTAPADWWDEDGATIATALAVLADRAAAVEAATRKGRR